MSYFSQRLHKSYSLIADPKNVSIAMSLIYFGAFLLGAMGIFDPPKTSLSQGTIGAMFSIGLLLCVGGLVGVPSALSGSYWAEKSAILFMILSLFLYSGIILYDTILVSGNKPYAIFSTYGSVVFFIIRFIRIHGLQYDTVVSKKGRAIERDLAFGSPVEGEGGSAR